MAGDLLVHGVPRSHCEEERLQTIHALGLMPLQFDPALGRIVDLACEQLGMDRALLTVLGADSSEWICVSVGRSGWLSVQGVRRSLGCVGGLYECEGCVRHSWWGSGCCRFHMILRRRIVCSLPGEQLCVGAAILIALGVDLPWQLSV